MARVTVNITKKLRRIYEVRDGTSIGRDPSCEIQLLDNSVSRVHARFEVSGARVKIVDLASANGVKVHGQRVDEWLLSDGDEIRIGKIAMHFEAAADAIPAQNVARIDRGSDPRKLVAKLSGTNAVRLISPTEEKCLEILNQTGEAYVRSRKGFSSYDVELLVAAMREAVGNAERHGNKSDPSKNVTLTFRDSSKEIRIIAQDEGPGFDFAKALRESRRGSAVEAARRNADEGKAGGLGIRLLLSAADHVNYLHNGSCVEIVKSKHTGQSAADTHEVTVQPKSDELIIDEVKKTAAAPRDAASAKSPATACTLDIEGDVVERVRKALPPPVAPRAKDKKPPEPEIVVPGSKRLDTWDSDLAVTPPPVAEYRSAAGLEPDSGENEIIEGEEVPTKIDIPERVQDAQEGDSIEDDIIIEEMEDIEIPDKAKKLHSTTWYVKRMEKRRESRRFGAQKDERQDGEDEPD